MNKAQFEARRAEVAMNAFVDASVEGKSFMDCSRAEDAALAEFDAAYAAAAGKWSVTVNPLCAGQYAISRKVGKRREFAKTTFGVGAVPMIASFYSRAEAQTAADQANS